MKLNHTRDGITVSVVLDRRTANKDGKFPVKVKVYHLRKPKYYSTGISLTDDEWSTLDKRKSAEYQAIKRDITKSYDIIKVNIDTLADSGEFSFQLLSLRLGRALGDTFNNVVKARIEELIKARRVGSAEIFRNTLIAVESFAGHQINFSDITTEWLMKCERYWEKQDMSITTRGMYFRNIRTMMNFAKSSGVIKESQYPFGKGKFEIQKEEGRKKALTIEQLKTIFNYRDENETVNKYKDLWCFIFLCSGINPLDMIQLRYSNIIDDEIHFVRQKTSRTSINRKVTKVSICPEMQAIIDKWGNPPSADNYIFPFLNGDETPEQIKAKNHDVFTRINKRMKTVCEALGIDRVTTYSARHSFATVMNHEDVPISYISEQLDHTSIRTTQTYLAGFDNKARQKNAKILTSFLH